MKPRNREVNIFNMSVLDLLTGALGAFCFLTLALFPFYFKAQKASAAPSKNDDTASLQARNESLKQQIAAEKASGRQMPPFAMLNVSGSNSQNLPCATFKLKSLTAPPGAPPMGYRALSPSGDGTYYAYYLFAVRTGSYHIVLSANLVRPGDCPVAISTTNVTSREKDQTINQSQDVEFDFDVIGGDFPASLFD